METAGMKYFLAAICVAALGGVGHAFGPVAISGSNPAVFRSSIGVPSATIGRVQSATQFASGLSNVLAYGSNNTAGNVSAVCVAGGDNPSAAVATVADTQLNSYNVAIATLSLGSAGGAELAAIYWAKNIAAGANTVTVTMGVGSTFSTIFIAEYSGFTSAASLVTTSSGSVFNNTGVDPVTGNLTTTGIGQLILSCYGDSTGGAQTITAGSGYTIVQKDESGSTHMVGALEDQGVGSPLASGTYTAGFSRSNKNSAASIGAAALAQ